MALRPSVRAGKKAVGLTLHGHASKEAEVVVAGGRRMASVWPAVASARGRGLQTNIAARGGARELGIRVHAGARGTKNHF